MDVATILNLIDVGEYGLPEFQRGYVWSREQVRRFMSSLYHENPVGSLLIWTTDAQMALMSAGTWKSTAAGNNQTDRGWSAAYSPHFTASGGAMAPHFLQGQLPTVF